MSKLQNLTLLSGNLIREFQPYSGMAVAVSGGVDSSTLLAAACHYFGPENCLGILAISPSLARSERESAHNVCAELNVELVEIQTQEMDSQEYRQNLGDRCYWCKRALFLEALPIAQFNNLPLAYGENAEDLLEERPGRRAAIQAGILAPLRDAGMYKSHVRHLAKQLGLKIAHKPASPCLASRIAKGVRVEIDDLNTIDIIESKIKSMGFSNLRARLVAPMVIFLEFEEEELKRAEGLKEKFAQLLEQYNMTLLGVRRYCSGAVA